MVSNATLNKLEFISYSQQLRSTITSELLAQISCVNDRRNDRLRAEATQLLQTLGAVVRVLENLK